MTFRQVARVVLVLATTPLAGCGRHTEDAMARVGALGPVDEADVSAYFDAARAVLSRSQIPKPPLHSRPGQRAFVTGWSRDHAPVYATGLGATLFDSVVAASQQLGKTAEPDARLELDVVTEVVRQGILPWTPERTVNVGLHGFLATDGGARFGWVLPSEILGHHWVLAPEGATTETRFLNGSALLQTLASRAGVPVDDARALEAYRVSVDGWLEPAASETAPIRLTRTLPAGVLPVSPEELGVAVRAGASYLARSTDEQGKLAYVYDPVTGEVGSGYGMLRHAGAIYALMSAYEETPDPAWLAASSRSIDYVKEHLRHVDDGSFVVDSPGEEQQKVGGAGLSLLALATYARVTGDLHDMPVMRSLARFVVRQQEADGHFRDNADVAREEPPSGSRMLPKEPWFFAGEATLSLVRFYAIDPDETWIAAARRAADYLVNVRDGRGGHRLPHDQWLSQALHELCVQRPTPTYSEHAKEIAREILRVERHGSVPYPDYEGSFSDDGDTTLASARLESLVSTMELVRWLGESDDWLRPPATRIAAFVERAQLRGPRTYFARFPDRALGGVRESLTSSTVRIDYVQHAICAWLHLARLLRDPAYGRRPP